MAAPELELDTTSTGLISLQSLQTCSDLFRGNQSASAQSPSASFDALRIKWNPKDRDLFVRQLNVTFKSSKLIGGSQEFSLTSDEIASLVGVSSGIISADETKGNKTIISNRSENREGFPLCSLNFGPLNFASANPGSFTANVTIELVGMSLKSSDGSNRKDVKKSFKTTAAF